jgi:hypothetical protein
MPWTPTDILHTFILVIGGFRLLKKVAEIDGHHTLRVVILTTIFSLPVILFFIYYGLTLGNPHSYGCVIDVTQPAE